jgi:hypothetical protein
MVTGVASAAESRSSNFECRYWGETSQMSSQPAKTAAAIATRAATIRIR